MLIFRLLHDWDSKNEESWDKLIHRQLGDKVHPNRKISFIRSREALLHCFAEVGQKLQIDELELESFSQLKNVKNFKISLAHNPEFGAGLIAKSSDYLSIGIDIEAKNRQVKTSILKRISHPQDLEFTPIVNWVIKEAAFKALMNTNQFEKPIEFSSIQIIKDRFIHENSGLNGSWELVSHPTLIIVQAWIKSL